ncbi:MAG: hypothetical protein JSV33_15570 [bacterium]|nr:MAG: hypothetical protein JSV33_15570 [bacterium]
MMNNAEERIVAKGLSHPGPLLIVKKKLPEITAQSLRVIVTGREAADGLAAFFEGRSASVSVDRTGDDYHVVVDLSNLEDTGDE